MSYKENDLVLIRLNNNPCYKGRQRHYNVWFRIMFIDNDGTFIGRVEKTDRDFIFLKIGEDIRFNVDKIQSKYNSGDQWCYGDNVTICECAGLCRNK